MSQTCLVCNKQGPFGIHDIQNVFDENNTFPSERKLIGVLFEIIDNKLDEEKVSTKILCKECYKLCENYDHYKTNMAILKMKLSELYYTTQGKTSLTQMAVLEPIKIIPKKETKGMFVVPASKLQPLPAGFQLNLGKIAAMANPNVLPSKPVNLKMTIGNSVLTQSLTTSTVKLVKPSELSADANTIKIGQVGQWNVSSLPNEIFSNGHESDNNDANNHQMEIDEGSKPTPVTQSDSILIDASSIKTENTEGARYMNSENFELLLEGQDDEDEDDEQSHTIVVDGNNSILQMMSGQKLVYENGELSFVMRENDDDEDIDEQDSNDEESQIELQVSGDEETANAIIAAAQEQGGAFIKVESGEMYRVKSVQSKPSESVLPDTATQLVARDGDLYRCLVCDNLRGSVGVSYTGSARDTVQHMKRQHSAQVYICALCGIIMRSRADYTTHMAEHSRRLGAPKTRLYACTAPACNKSYNSRTLLHEHGNLHAGTRPYACHICDKTFASKYTRQAHLKTHQVRPRPYECQVCGKSFLSRQNLMQHEKTHLGIKSFICNICEKAFGTQHSLEVHGVVHSGQKAHVCDVCEKAFARRAELVDHARIHTGERPFECEVCGAKFSQRSNLHSHRRATHLDDKRHTCPDCPKRFKRRRLLQYHIKAAHTGERPLKCDVCFSTFVYPEHYKKHIRIHNGERPYYCEICGKAFNSRDNRNTHRFVHSDKKPYECLACGASYMRKRMLVAHMNDNGHLAESIVVNQPRVTKVSENLFADQQSKSDMQLVDADKNVEVSAKIEEVEENAKLYTISGDEPVTSNAEAAIITTVNSETLDPQQITDENGSIFRFIQVQMPDGKDGWVALND